MPIHLGKLIKKEAMRQKYSQSKFGEKINTTKQNVSDIYKRSSIDTALLLTISKALSYDFFAVYYNEEPLKSMKEKELAQYKEEIEELRKTLAIKEDKIRDLERVTSSNEMLINVLKEERKEYKKGKK